MHAMAELLFELPLPDRSDRERIRILRARKRGLYADVPGSGPHGETCGSCKHARRMGNVGKKTWAKCRRMQARWTSGAATDIRLRTPACRKWEAAG